MRAVFAVFSVFVLCLSCSVHSLADDTIHSAAYSATEEASGSGGDVDTAEPEQHCPATRISDNDKCLACHVKPSFELKEDDPHARYDYPSWDAQFVLDEDGEPVSGYYKLVGINADKVKDVLDYMFERHGLDKVVIEMHSPGGNMWDALRIIGIFKEWQAQGKVIGTKVNGFAASAGFMLLAAGSPGHRMANSQALIMWHEIIVSRFFDMGDAAAKEDEAERLRYFQDNSNEWLASVSDLSKQEIDDKIHKQELWMTGKQALEYGFVDSVY
jgi:ATP-dependent protease ClpP protease subunit